jgi:multidrug efflux pump subunit AcrB
MSGAPVTDLRDGNRMVGIELRATADERASLATLRDITIAGAQGGQVSLAQVARIVPGSEPPILWRRNGDVVLSVRSDVVDGVQAPDVTRAILPALQPIIDDLPIGYGIDQGGAIEESAKADAALFKVMPVMFLVMLALIMIQVRSFARMILVFVTFPLGFIGASISLGLSGLPFGFVALLGTLALGGIIVRNTLILADQIEADRAAGMSMRDAIIETTVRRARPVILTALAAVLAFMPLTLTAFWAPLAVVLIGGTLIGTVLTLCALPALYAAWFRIGSRTEASGPESIVTEATTQGAGA